MRFNAFTVLEFVVAMVITSVVIGLGYQAWGMLSDSSNQFGIKKSALQDLNTLDYLLRRDFMSAEAIHWNDTELSCVMKHGLITYQFEQQTVIRNGVMTDTFQINLMHVKPSYLNLDKSADILEFIEFGFLVSGNTYNQAYFKAYSTGQLSRMDKINAN